MEHIYGVPLWLMTKYLIELGGITTEAKNTIAGDGWQATVREAEPARIGPTLKVGRIAVEFSGSPPDIADLLERLHWKTMRGGG
jgi:hypothetical protein